MHGNSLAQSGKRPRVKSMATSYAIAALPASPGHLSPVRFPSPAALRGGSARATIFGRVKRFGMNPDLQNLKDLQVTDREMARLSQEIAALPRRVAVIEAKLADSKARKEKALAAIKAGDANKRKYESQ